MSYTFTLLTTKADCDTMIALANKNKAELEYRKVTLVHKKARAAESSVSIETELQSVIAEIASTESWIATLPDGKAKDDAISKKTHLEYKRFVLNERKESYGIVSLLETEVDIGCIDLDIQETDAFIAGVNERKGNL